MKRFIVFAAVFLTLFLPSCYVDKEDLLYGNQNCDTSNVSFSTEIMPIIRSSCAVTGCHVQGGSGNGLFENYTQVKSKVDNGSMKNRVVVLKDMPPSVPLTSCQVKHIEQWIINGAPNN